MDIPRLVETVAAGDEAVSRLVLQALGWRVDLCACPTAGRGIRRPEPGLWVRPDGEYHFTALPAVSEDPAAARSLMAAEVAIEAGAAPGGGGRWQVTAAGADGRAVMAAGASLALALCGLALRLRGG